ncbi:MAG: hypothetical protein JWL77_6021 [Chthonomonadaceae bacterium]|nr:hypothetical protein [Chthonomonadaceae bacterium]
MSVHHDPPHHNPAHHSPAHHEPVISAQERQQSRGDGGWRGFIVAILGYLFVSLQQPLGWGMPLWIFLAFLLVPGLAGLAVGFAQRGAGTPGRSLWTAIKSAGKAMALYTIMHLLLLGGPHSDSADRWQERIAGVLTTILYSLVAGLVAGAVSMTVSSIGVKERQG